MLYDPKWEKPIIVAPLEPWRQLLTEAAAKIDRRGLAKGEALGCDGSLCTMGALQELSQNFNLIMRAVKELRRFLRTENIPLWNVARMALRFQRQT